MLTRLPTTASSTDRPRLRAVAGALLLVAALSLAACSRAEAPSTTSAPPGGTTPPGTSAPAAAPSASAPEPANVAEVFPAGPGRDLVLANCASCHNVACAATGQRTNARWDALKVAHADRVSGVDLDLVFTYLKTHFNDSQPEPRVPASFLQGGCTPF